MLYVCFWRRNLELFYDSFWLFFIWRVLKDEFLRLLFRGVLSPNWGAIIWNEIQCNIPTPKDRFPSKAEWGCINLHRACCRVAWILHWWGDLVPKELLLQRALLESVGVILPDAGLPAASNAALWRLKGLWIITELTDVSLFPFCDWPSFSAVTAQIPSGLAFNRPVLFTGLLVPRVPCCSPQHVHERVGGRNQESVWCVVTQSLKTGTKCPQRDSRDAKDASSQLPAWFSKVWSSCWGNSHEFQDWNVSREVNSLHSHQLPPVIALAW